MPAKSRILVAIATSMLTVHATAEITFSEHEVVTGSAQHQTILTGHFLGGPMADVAVVSLDDQGGRHLQILSFEDGTWAQKLEAPLGREALFVDVARSGDRDRLICYEHGRVVWFDPESANRGLLVQADVKFNDSRKGQEYAGTEPMTPSGEGEVPHVDVTRDLNRDGRDDLVLPSVDGFWVATQRADGSFSEPVMLGPPEPFRNNAAFDDTRSYGKVGISALTIPWYLTRVHEMDYDLDGRNDLVFWNGDHFDVHHQDAQGEFSPEAVSFSTKVPFDSDGTYSVIFGFGFEGASTASLLFGFRKKTRQTMLVSLRDVNGDQVADLTTFTLEGRSILRMRGTYEIHFGAPDSGGVAFEQAPGTNVQPRVTTGGMAHAGYSSTWREDFDGDGQVDIMVGGIKIGFGAMVRAILGTTITMSSEIFRQEDGVFPAKPDVKRLIKSDIDNHGGRNAGFFPAVVVGDVNGDGRTDVLVGKNRQELHVYLGATAPEVLSKQPQKIAIRLPGDERNTWLADMNGDDKQDILLYHPANAEPGHLTLLVSR